MSLAWRRIGLRFHLAPCQSFGRSRLHIPQTCSIQGGTRQERHTLFALCAFTHICKTYKLLSEVGSKVLVIVRGCESFALLVCE